LGEKTLPPEKTNGLFKPIFRVGILGGFALDRFFDFVIKLLYNTFKLCEVFRFLRLEPQGKNSEGGENLIQNAI
jgi:hypothetical protein